MLFFFSRKSQLNWTNDAEPQTYLIAAHADIWHLNGVVAVHNGVLYTTLGMIALSQ